MSDLTPNQLQQLADLGIRTERIYAFPTKNLHTLIITDLLYFTTKFIILPDT